jgi:hypothetical protein
LKPVNGPVTEYPASTAEEFWEVLSPQKYLFRPRDKPIFRGQARAWDVGKEKAWDLEPSIFRERKHPVYAIFGMRASPEVSENQIFAEILTLQTFAGYCDSTGFPIPGDSEVFRTTHLDPTKVMDSFIFHRRIWPSREYFDIMALAQHYRLPTRLLDWTHSSYVAAYFAASSALQENQAEGGLAVWALNTENIPHTLRDIEIIQVPGSNNVNVAAQSGLFTLLRQRYTRGNPFEGPHCLNHYVESCKSQDLAKITLRVQEAPKIIDLCERHGVTAATLFPGFHGAAKATLEYLACWSRSEWSDGRDIRAQRRPVSSLGPT